MAQGFRVRGEDEQDDDEEEPFHGEEESKGGEQSEQEEAPSTEAPPAEEEEEEGASYELAPQVSFVDSVGKKKVMNALRYMQKMEGSF